jgi:hypothetical protein
MRIGFKILCVFGGALLGAQAAEFHVSPTGDQPFSSIEAACDAARPFCGKEPVTVWLHGGTYTVSKTVELDNRDSGTADKPVVYKAFPGETPVISGGKKLSGWQRDGNVIWKAPTHGMEFRQLYVNGKKATRSRWPNLGEYNRLVDWNATNQTINLKQGDVRNWENFDEVEIYVQMLWSISIMRLDSFVNEAGHSVLTVQNPERDLVFKRLWPKKIPNQAFHYENAREFIDQPGEWCINRKKGEVYYYPRPGENMQTAEVIVPQVETLLAVKGTLDRPVKYLTFEGITFLHSTWLLPNERGYLNNQAGQYSIEPTVENVQFVGRPPGAVEVKCAHNCVFKRNVFKKLGAVGLDLHFGTRDCEVVGNVFYDIAGSGIQHAKFSDPDVEVHLSYNPKDERELCVNDRIHNNYIENIGYEYGGAIGILSGWPVGLQIDHNELRNLAYSGISVGWGWTKEPNAMRDNKIRWNHVDRPMTLFGDGGGIYTLSEMPGTHIYRNYVSGVRRSEWALGASSKCYFLDEGSGGITLQENLEQCAENIERLRLHQNGEVVIKPIHASMYPEIIKGAGLEPEYKAIRKVAVD